MYCVSHKTVLVLADNMNIGKQMLGCVDIFKLNTDSLIRIIYYNKGMLIILNIILETHILETKGQL